MEGEKYRMTTSRRDKKKKKLYSKVLFQIRREKFQLVQKNKMIKRLGGIRDRVGSHVILLPHNNKKYQSSIMNGE